MGKAYDSHLLTPQSLPHLWCHLHFRNTALHHSCLYIAGCIAAQVVLARKGHFQSQEFLVFELMWVGFYLRWIGYPPHPPLQDPLYLWSVTQKHRAFKFFLCEFWCQQCSLVGSICIVLLWNCFVQAWLLLGAISWRQLRCISPQFRIRQYRNHYHRSQWPLYFHSPLVLEP